MRPYPPTFGVVLAGGRSRRMGGRDKAELPLGNEPMIAGVAQRLAAQCAAVVINANGDAARFDYLRLPVIPDPYPDFRGPLAGILAAMDWMAEHHPAGTWLVSIAVDTPFFPEDFVAKLHEARAGSDALLTMARSGNREHPVNTLWHSSLRDDLRQAVAAGATGRVQDWIKRYPFAVAAWALEPFDPFLNINTPEDFEAARASFG